LIAVLILLPAGALSFYHELNSPGSQRIFRLTPADAAAPSAGTKLQLVLESVTPWTNSAQVRVTGQRDCSEGCPATQIIVASLPDAHAPSGTLPSVETIEISAGSSDFSRIITLPVEGQWLDYPFDSYHLTLAVAQRQNTGGAPAGERAPLSVTLEERLSELDLKPPRVLQGSPTQLKAADPNGVVAEISMSRSFYVQAISATIVLLAVAAAVYGVFMRPFRELVIGATGLSLSLWGIRNLLLGSTPGPTAIDFVLLAVITFVLVGITARVFIALIENKSAE
jgi:hypothetical protein